MTKTKQDNNVTNPISVVYLEKETKLSWPIEYGAIYEKKWYRITTWLWTRIFHVCPHSIGETHFLFSEKNYFWKSLSRHLFYFILKGKIKQERKP